MSNSMNEVIAKYSTTASSFKIIFFIKSPRGLPLKDITSRLKEAIKVRGKIKFVEYDRQRVPALCIITGDGSDKELTHALRDKMGYHDKEGNVIPYPWRK